MSEHEPQRPRSEQDEIPVPLHGPNIVSSLDSPPRPAAIKVHQAVIRKHLLEQKAQPDR
jgi:hypothetical protein